MPYESRLCRWNRWTPSVVFLKDEREDAALSSRKETTRKIGKQETNKTEEKGKGEEKSKANLRRNGNLSM
jgi:hypothetical protein